MVGPTTCRNLEKLVHHSWHHLSKLSFGTQPKFYAISTQDSSSSHFFTSIFGVCFFPAICFLVPKLAAIVASALELFFLLIVAATTFIGVALLVVQSCTTLTLGSECLAVDVLVGITLSLLWLFQLHLLQVSLCCKCQFFCLILFLACGTINDQVCSTRSMD